MPPDAKAPKGNACAIVVTYQPDALIIDRLGIVLAQFPRVIVVDNASDETKQALLMTLAAEQKISLIVNQANLGIAKALNQGMAQALLEGFSWAVTLDQDSEVFPDMLETLLRVNDQCGFDKVFVGGNYENVNKKRNFVDCETGGKGFLERKTLITSGTLMPLQMAAALGGFREDYIDSVDHEFCLRARANGFKILITCKPIMRQRIGSTIEASPWLSNFASFNHSPLRKFYIARNTLVTAREYCGREPAWALRQGWRLLSDFGSILVFEAGKYRKAKAFLLGIVSGIRGNMGPLTAEQRKFLGFIDHERSQDTGVDTQASAASSYVKLLKRLLVKLHLKPNLGSRYAHRNQAYRLLSGRGLEVGALHCPAKLPEYCSVEYCDAHSKADSAKLFPEIEYGLLVEVDYLVNLDEDRLANRVKPLYDFVIMNHVIEHVANPLSVLEQLFTVVRPGGYVLVSAPDKWYTFDKPRQLTTFHHLYDEYQKGVTAVDDEHYLDFIRHTAPEDSSQAMPSAWRQR